MEVIDAITVRGLNVETTGSTLAKSATVVMTVTIARPSSVETTELISEKNAMEE